MVLENIFSEDLLMKDIKQNQITSAKCNTLQVYDILVSGDKQLI